MGGLGSWWLSYTLMGLSSYSQILVFTLILSQLEPAYLLPFQWPRGRLGVEEAQGFRSEWPL